MVHIAEQRLFNDVEGHPIMPWAFIDFKWEKGVYQLLTMVKNSF